MLEAGRHGEQSCVLLLAALALSEQAQVVEFDQAANDGEALGAQEDSQPDAGIPREPGMASQAGPRQWQVAYMAAASTVS